MTILEVAIMTGTAFDERYVPNLPKEFRWQFDLIGVGVKDGVLLLSSYGRGKTLASAKKDYAEQLQGKMIVVNALRPDRHEYLLPPRITARC